MPYKMPVLRVMAAPKPTPSSRQYTLDFPPTSDEKSTGDVHDPAAAACNYWDFCSNCGTELMNAGCKYRCPRCHYFMSCSDFD